MRIAAIVIGIIASMSAPAETQSIRVVSYNIHHGEGSDGAVDLERIADILRGLDADVICLQEVDRNLPRTDKRDLPAELSALLGMQVFFDSNFDWEGGEYGNATLTALPVSAWENIALPGPSEAEPRGCLRTTLQVDGVEIDVLNTHLGLKSAERSEQAAAILKLVSSRPTILAGDLNDRPDAAPIIALTAQLRDAAGPENAAPTYPATKSRARIDFILATDAFTATAFRTIQTPETAVASDHLPIVADFSFPAAVSDSEADGGIVDAADERVSDALH